MAVGLWVTLPITHLEVRATLFPIAQTRKALLCGCNSVDIKIICFALLLSIDKSGPSLGTKRLQQNKRTILKVCWFFELTVFNCAETMNVLMFWTYLVLGFFLKKGIKIELNVIGDNYCFERMATHTGTNTYNSVSTIGWIETEDVTCLKPGSI